MMAYACHPHTLGAGMGELYVQGRLEQFFEKNQGLDTGGLANGMPFIVGSQVKNTFVYRDLDIHMSMYVYICIYIFTYIFLHTCVHLY